MAVSFSFDEYSDNVSESEAQGMVDIIMDALHHPNEPRPVGESIFGEIAKQ